ncbi:MAG: outer membrane beta-barrel protein [Alphaproteobacteria bacterium]|nr:outer membrane beta-barrel protein [Alphaproteobacteria bacterium]
MSKRITAIIAASLAVTVPATAADLYIAPEPPAPIISGESVYNWTGFRVGIGFGTTMMNNYLRAPALAAGSTTIGGLGDRGFVGTLSAGYDHALANGVIVGASVLGRYGDADTSVTGGGTSAEIKADYGFDVVGRLGYSITPRTMAYLLGGYSWQHFKLSGTGPTVSQNWGASGYVVGFGTETAIRDNWTWSSEYRYANYGSEGVTPWRGNIDPVIHSFYTSINYRPNGGPSGQTMAPVIHDWNGLKVGGALGIGVALNKITTTGGTVFDKMSNEAFLADVNIGYDREFGAKWLGGVVLAAGYDGGRSQLVSTGGASIAKTEDFGFDAMLRVGRKINNQTLAYVIGGYSWQKMSTTIAGTGTNSTGVSGFTIGTGSEFALSEKLSAFVEYRYSGYQDYNVTPAITVDPSDHSVRVGAKWKLY